MRKRGRQPDDFSRDVINAEVRQQDAALKSFCQCAVEVLEVLKRATEDETFSALSTQTTLLEEQLKRLRAEEETPFSIVLVGDTGHGKSTLINALLDESSCVPTDNLNAGPGTASIVELRYKNPEEEGKDYTAKIHFVSKESWDADITDFFEIHKDGDTPESSALESKINAVYGNNVIKDIKAKYDKSDQRIEELKHLTNAAIENLDQTIIIESDDPDELREKLDQYVVPSETNVSNDEDGQRQPQFWPVLERVVVKSKNWGILSGVELIDAPGLRDPNSARTQVTRKRLLHAHQIFLVARVDRAANNETAEDILKGEFHKHLERDGQLRSLAFICTMSDNVNIEAVRKNAQLPKLKRALTAQEKDECARLQKTETLKHVRRHISALLCESDCDDSAKLPVFCVSSRDYQILEGLRPEVSDRNMFLDAEDTEIPKLKHLLINKGKDERQNRILSALDQFLAIIDVIQGQLHHDEGKTLEVEKLDRLRQKFARKVFLGFKQAHQKMISDVNSLSSFILQCPAEEMAMKFTSIAEGWMKNYHHSTLKEVVRKNGAFNSKTYGWIDFNSQLIDWIETETQPKSKEILEDPMSLVPSYLKDFRVNFRKAAARFRRKAKKLEGSLVTKAAVQTMLKDMNDRVEIALRRVKQAPKVLRTEMWAEVREAMKPGYERANSILGDHSHAYRCDELVVQVKKLSTEEHGFNGIIRAFARGFDLIPKDVEDILGVTEDGLASSLKLWFHPRQRADGDDLQTARVQETKLRILDCVESAKGSLEQMKQIMQTTQIMQEQYSDDFGDDPQAACSESEDDD